MHPQVALGLKESSANRYSAPQVVTTFKAVSRSMASSDTRSDHPATPIHYSPWGPLSFSALPGGGSSTPSGIGPTHKESIFRINLNPLYTSYILNIDNDMTAALQFFRHFLIQVILLN